MAEGEVSRRRVGGGPGVPIASPLFSDGVHHAEVSSPTWGVAIPDPLGYLAASPPEMNWMNTGGGDDVNDWKETSFSDDGD